MREQELTRRGFFKWGGLAALTALFPGRSLAAIADRLSPERVLSFYNLHTEEHLEISYWSQGKYVPDALDDINNILRDHRTGEIRAIDTRLLDLLHSIVSKLGSRQPFHVISGYRSPETNAFLRSRMRGVAKNSMHMGGKAVDIRLPSCRLPLLRQVAMNIKAGGVGYYPHSNFIHIDVGKARYW